jgi:6-phosphogluconolactonase (cycloisomerase 2 family)
MLSASALLRRTVLAEAPLAHELNRTWLLCTASQSRANPLAWDLRAYAPRGRQWRLIAQTADVQAVGGIAVHPTRRRLYIAHDTESFNTLPRANVSTWDIREAQGEFVAAGEEPLTLSATRPRSIAAHPRGDSLLIAVTGGGLYNTLPLDPAGNIVPGKHALKLTGCGPHPTQHAAQPAFVQFNGSGDRAYACDFGTDQVHRLHLGRGIPRIEQRLSLEPGTGPRHLAMHPSERLVAVVGSLQPTLTMIAIDGNNTARVTCQHRLDAQALHTAAFVDRGAHLHVYGRTQADEPCLFHFAAHPGTLTLEALTTQVVPAERAAAPYTLVATNVPLPYSPIATSPENVLPLTAPLNT